MAIVAGDIVKYLSGGAANTTANLSLGGAGNAAATITSAVSNNLFDDTSGAESTSGATDYRCIYIKNTHATLTYSSASVFISASPTAGVTVDIGLDPIGVNGTATTIANEATVPTGVTFSHPVAAGTLSLGSLAPGDFYAVWIKRTIAPATAGAAATFDLGVNGNTLP